MTRFAEQLAAPQDDEQTDHMAGLPRESLLAKPPPTSEGTFNALLAATRGHFDWWTGAASPAEYLRTDSFESWGQE